MPGFPHVGASVEAMKGSVFSALAHRLKTYEGPVYPLHVGDTWMEPAEGCRMEDFQVSNHPGMHRYSNPHGRPDLLHAIAEVKGTQMGCELSMRQILVSAGATGGLGAVLGSILSPGDEVMILAPYWPLIAGIVRSFRGTPVLVPVMGQVEDEQGLEKQLEAYRSERTVAVYFNSPNNPTGELMPASWMATVADWARKTGCWILSDEVYDLYVYEGRHTYMHGFAPERTFSSFSFSKAYGMAGNRCGFVIGPEEIMSYAQKISTHSFYSTPTASQMAAHAALTTDAGSQWVERARTKYKELGRWAAERLQVTPPKGGTFIFMDIADALDEGGLVPFLETCVDRGLLVGPGPSFGPYPTHIRLCFTSIEPERMKEGVNLLAELLGR